MNGWQTLFYKEVLRFWKVAFQTIAGPVLTAMLYLLIFGHALEDHVKVYDQVSYTAFFGTGPGHDEPFAKCLCQQLILAHYEQGDG
jgi:ABC-2 type transport system permease protein